MDYKILLEQHQQLSQSQIQSLEILALDNVELESFLQNEHLENPLLEYTPSQLSPWEEKPYVGGGYTEGVILEESSRELAAAQENVIKDYLLEQLPMEQYTKEEWRLIDFLIDSLDRQGFFSGDISETAKMNGVPEMAVKRCLEDLKELEPTGIFSRDLKECLKRQLSVLDIENKELDEIIENHLEDVAEGRISSISRKMKLSTLQTRKYIAIIEHLNPRPMAGFSTGKTEYIVPDVIVRQGASGWEVVLNDSWLGECRLSDYYMRMMQETKDTELRDYFGQKLERARFITNCIEQRKRTMLMIGEALLEKQKGYFMGQEPLKPMTMTALAEQLEISPSTVSRAVKGKYIQFPQKTTALKNLFSSNASKAMEEEENEGVTAEEIKTYLRKLIQEEDKRKPYSDARLVTLLEEKKIRISRRAVAKYREAMGIRGSFERKE